MENTGVGQIAVFGEQLLHELQWEMFSTSDSKQKLDFKKCLEDVWFMRITEFVSASR